MKTLKVAAVQMRASIGEVEANLERARGLAREAFQGGADWVILPEFFTSAVAFHPKMLKAARLLEGSPQEMLKSLARETQGVVGGSFIASRGSHCYNTFVLAFPDGSTFFHDKDQPTMWENCYYLGGNDEGVLDTPAGKVGVALCWELIRSRTARRLLGRVDFVVGGSCWWTLPEILRFGIAKRVHEKNLKIMAQTPARLARILGVHLVHAAHAGEFEAGLPLVPGVPYRSYFLGETQIVDGAGKVLARMTREDGEGYIMAQIDPAKRWEPDPLPDRFWIPDLPLMLRLAWHYQNRHGKNYYRIKTLPYRKKLSTT